MNSSGARANPDDRPGTERLTVTICPQCEPAVEPAMFGENPVLRFKLCRGCEQEKKVCAGWDTRFVEHQAYMAQYRQKHGICPQCGRSG